MDIKFSRVLALLVFTVSIPCSVLASNTAVNGVSARALSMQAFTAVADDPSSIFYNPAGLATLKGTQVQADVQAIYPDQTFVRRSDASLKTSSNKSVYAPSLFVSSDHFKKVSLGLGIYAPFARDPKYNANPATNNLPENAKLMRLDFVPTAAVNLAKNLSFGLGFVLSHVTLHTDQLGVDETSSGNAYTFQSGLLWRPCSNLSLGLTYRGSEKVHLKGKGKSTTAQSDFSTNFKFPATISAGIAWQATSKFLTTFQVDDELWSYVKRVFKKYDTTGVNNNTTIAVDGHDAFTYRLGGIYRMDTKNEFRAGASYIDAAIPKRNIAPAQPDYNMYAFSVGYSRYVSQHLRLDLGYEYAYQPGHRRGDSAVPAYQGQYKINVNTLMLGVNYQFV